MVYFSFKGFFILFYNYFRLSLDLFISLICVFFLFFCCCINFINYNIFYLLSLNLFNFFFLIFCKIVCVCNRNAVLVFCFVFFKKRAIFSSIFLLLKYTTNIVVAFVLILCYFNFILNTIKIFANNVSFFSRYFV